MSTRHYEIVLLLHPEHGPQIETLLAHFQQWIEAQQGKIHRFENLGRRALAYEVEGLTKAYYSLLNIETTPETLKSLEEQFHYNETVIRHLIPKMDEAVTEPSPLAKAQATSEKEASVQAHRNHAKPSSAAEAPMGPSSEPEGEEGGMKR